jgi:hypothetical protein
VGTHCFQRGLSAPSMLVHVGQPDWTRLEPWPWKYNPRVDDSPGVTGKGSAGIKDAALENKICYAYWWWGLVVQLFWRSTNQSNCTLRVPNGGDHPGRVTATLPVCTLAR